MQEVKGRSWARNIRKRSGKEVGLEKGKEEEKKKEDYEEEIKEIKVNKAVGKENLLHLGQLF